MFYYIVMLCYFAMLFHDVIVIYRYVITLFHIIMLYIMLYVIM